ncbi:histone-fold-containing protein [Mycena belliarum]|uniref:DNA polymerase epsilon subunit D n=1 Tax=Mycena belliarum TaxID=1033014 RepID=A0AAD6XPF7_9AGAR|nr:histone-fold-containing protein [Mycena belliae]
MPRKEPLPGSISAQTQQETVTEGMENFELPKSLVTRIARSALPENVKMQKETVLSLIKGSTVFINYLGAAHDVALSKQHKSISASDVLKALEMIQFGDLVDKLQAELVVYREQAKTDKSKKGSSNVNSSIVKGKTPSSASTPKAVSIKGKEKATIVLPALASAAALEGDVGESISSALGFAMDVDDVEAEPFVQVDTDGEGEGEGERLEEEEEPEPEFEEPEDVDDEEPEELVDTAALEAEELRRDARGPDEPLAVMED